MNNNYLVRIIYYKNKLSSGIRTFTIEAESNTDAKIKAIQHFDDNTIISMHSELLPTRRKTRRTLVSSPV